MWRGHCRAIQLQHPDKRNLHPLIGRVIADHHLSPLLDARLTLHLDLDVKFPASSAVIFKAIRSVYLLDHVSLLRMVEHDRWLSWINRRRGNSLGCRHLRQHGGNQQQWKERQPTRRHRDTAPFVSHYGEGSKLPTDCVARGASPVLDYPAYWVDIDLSINPASSLFIFFKPSIGK